VSDAPPSLPADRPDRLLAWGVLLATAWLMAATHRPVGHVRDEGYYFTAAASYEGWFVELGRSFAEKRFLEPFRDETIARHWQYNDEHPPLAKTLFALSHLVFHRWLGWLDDTAAWRIPAFLLAGLLSFALFHLARPHGRAAALLAPALFWAVPRHFFHGHLAAFDIPTLAFWCLFLLVWTESESSGRGAWKVGVVFGLALATKHNALFLPFAAALQWLAVRRPWRRGFEGFFASIPRAAWAMAILGPLVLYALWPWLWHHPFDRAGAWIGFHTHHVHYPWQYFGTVLRAPPFPHLYPLVLEGLTVPVATLAAMTAGLGWLAVRAIGCFSARIRVQAGEASPVEWSVFLGALVAVAPFLTGTTPIFGGVKHWMALPALACVPAAALIVESARALGGFGRLPRAAPIVPVLVLAAGAWQAAHFHPWGTPAYNELAGGAAGGAALGMQRQYWSNNVTAVLPWVNAHAPRGAAVYFHEVNVESFRAYQDDGLVRRDLRYAWGVAESSVAAYQYHREFRDREWEIWGAYGTRTPAFVFALDETPQVVVYARAGRGGG